VPPPLNYVLVTITMLGGSAAAGAYAMGLVSDALSSVAFTTSAIVVSAAGAVVVGFPLLVSRFRIVNFIHRLVFRFLLRCEATWCRSELVLQLQVLLNCWSNPFDACHCNKFIVYCPETIFP